jgi:dephospho-CoA kinase
MPISPPILIRGIEAMLRIGLTGSIGMGKSTTAGFFREFGVPVHDADAAVHALYAGPAAAAVEAAFPGSTVVGKVDRTRLGPMVVGKAEAMKRLEAIVHPLVRAHENAFVESAHAEGHKAVVLDIPLLFETGGENRVDLVVVVSCPPEEQRRRVLARPGMTEERFAAILAAQMPDAEKRRRADVIIETGQGLAAARNQVRQLVDRIASGAFKPKSKAKAQKDSPSA